MRPTPPLHRRPPRPRRSACAGLLPLLLAALALPGCAPEPERGRVLLVGIDGATLRIAEPMLRAGRLPNLERIARAGVFGPLQAHFPLVSPRIWTSIATGKLPRHHGILGFAHPTPDGDRALYVSTDRRVHALWNIASQRGRTVSVVNWWSTYPVEKVKGVLVSDHLISMDLEGRRELTGAEIRERGPIVHPEEWAARVEALREFEGSLTGLPDPFRDRDAFPRWVKPDRLSLRWRNDELVLRIALAVEEALHPDLSMIFFPGIDRVSHVLWASVEPEEAYPDAPLTLEPEHRAAMAGALHAYYEYTDAGLGLLLEHFGAEDLVMVVSDHGFEADIPIFGLTGGHTTAAARDGVIFARGPGIGAPERPRPVSVNDVAPTILAWWGWPVAEDMDGEPADFLREAPEIARIATYDTQPIERAADAPSGAEDEILEQLEALGYLEHGGSGDAE